MKRIVIGAPMLWSAIMLAPAFAYGAEEPATVGSVAEDNGLQKNGWAIVKTPSILRVEPSDPVAPDLNQAIEHYERIVALPAVDTARRAEAMRRAAYLRLQRAEAGPYDARDVRRAVALYEQLLKETPQDPGNDRTLYQLAHAYQVLGDGDASVNRLQQLMERFPQSALTGDGGFRAAELLYSRGRYAEAERAYRKVLALGSKTPFFETAEFKLGWSLYQQARYPQALPVFAGILDRELPPGDLDDARRALEHVTARRRDVVGDALRLTYRSFAALGGGPAVNDHYGRNGEPRYARLIYDGLARHLVEHQRYTDAAGVYIAYLQRHPRSPQAPEFQSRIIASYQQGGFSELMLQAKEQYVRRYAPDSDYWQGPPRADVLAQVQSQIDEIAQHYQAVAQQLPPDDATRSAAFLAAADRYRLALEWFPDDPKAGERSLLQADCLYDSGRIAAAAQQYENAAYQQRPHARSAEAAFAAVQAYQRLERESAPAALNAARQRSIAASLKLADRYRDHPQSGPVLTQAAQDLMALKDYPQAAAVAQRALDDGKGLSPELRRYDLAVAADAHFAQGDYAQAERDYAALLNSGPGDTSETMLARDQLAAAIYRQAEQARDAGNNAAAAAHFVRVGKVAPQTAIRANADYDAAASYAALKQWASAADVLEGFRQRDPQHRLIGDVDRRLADAYQQDGKPKLAADAYMRLAQRDTGTPAQRRDAAWSAALLYDGANQPIMSQQAYERFLADASAPLDQAQQARRRLADIAGNITHDPQRQQSWLEQIVSRDRQAGNASSDRSRLLAAQASLDLGRKQAKSARQIALALPLDKTLMQRKQATEAAIARLDEAARYGFADVTTAATFELGSVYRDFGRAILESTRPITLSGEALAEYELLLEEQADPFEVKAIQAHEANLGRMRQGVWNDWIRRSASALMELAPGRYGKNDQRDALYDSLL